MEVAIHVNKQCSAEFIQTLARKKHALHILLIPFKDAGEWQQLDVQDPASGLSELVYRCKIIIDYGCEAPDYITANVIRGNASLPGVAKDDKKFIEYLPQWIASIPNVRNVEIVHADRLLEMEMYEPEMGRMDGQRARTAKAAPRKIRLFRNKITNFNAAKSDFEYSPDTTVCGLHMEGQDSGLRRCRWIQ